MESPSQDTIGKLLAGSILTAAAAWLYRFVRLWVLERRKVTADAHLTDSQAAVQAATAGKIRVETEGSLLDRMAAYCDRVEERLKEEHLRVMALEAEKKVLEARIDLHEDQMRKVKGVLEAHGLKFPD